MSEDVSLAIIGILPQLLLIGVVAALPVRHRTPIGEAFKRVNSLLRPGESR